MATYSVNTYSYGSNAPYVMGLSVAVLCTVSLQDLLLYKGLISDGTVVDLAHRRAYRFGVHQLDVPILWWTTLKHQTRYKEFHQVGMHVTCASTLMQGSFGCNYVLEPWVCDYFYLLLLVGFGTVVRFLPGQ